MASVATTFVPSSTNLKGGLAGIVASLAVGLLAHAGYLAIAAAAIGIPEATVSLVAMGAIGAIANVVVTHVTELKEADSFVNALQSIKMEDSYPTDAALRGNQYPPETDNPPQV